MGRRLIVRMLVVALACLAALPAAAQNTRFDAIATTTAGSGQSVPLLAIPGVAVSFWNEPGMTLANVYNSATSGTACPTNAQVVLRGSSSCVSTADNQGNFGGWFAAGQYAYTFTAFGQTFGPFPFTVGAGGGGSGTVTSVGVTAPAWMTVTGSPVTGAGTIGLAGASGLTAHQVLGTGAGGTLSQETLSTLDLPFTYSGNTTKLATVGAGSLPTNDVPKFDASSNLVDSGVAAGVANNIAGTLAAGSNVTVTGSGTTGSPYTISSTGGGGTSGAAGVVQASDGAGGHQATHCTDNGTTVACTEQVTAPSLVSGTPSSAAKAALPSGAHGLSLDESSTAGVPAAGVAYIRADTTGLVESVNGGAEVPIGGGSGVASIDSQTGAFTFGGTAVSHVGTAYTFTEGVFPFPEVPVENFGAVGYSTQAAAVAGTDSTTAINNCEASLTGGGVCILRNAFYKVTGAITIALSNTGIVGANATVFPTVAPGPIPGSVLVSTSASANILHVGGSSGSPTYGNTVSNLTLARSLLPTGTSSGLFLDYTSGATVSNVVSQDSVYDFHLHASGLFGGGGFFNDSALHGWNGLTETTGSMYGYFLDTVDGTYNASTYFSNCIANEKPGVTAATYGEYIYGQNTADSVNIGFNTAFDSYPIWVQATGGGLMDDLHFIAAVLDSTGVTAITVKNFSGSNNAITFNETWEQGNTAGVMNDIESSSGVAFTAMQTTSPGSGATPPALYYFNSSPGNSLTDSTLVAQGDYQIYLNNSSNNILSGLNLIAQGTGTTGINLVGSSYNTISNDSFYGQLGGSYTAGIVTDSGSGHNTGFETDTFDSTVATPLGLSGFLDNPTFFPNSEMHSAGSYTYWAKGNPNPGFQIGATAVGPCPSTPVEPDGNNSNYTFICAPNYPEAWMRINSDATDQKNWRFIGVPPGIMYYGITADDGSSAATFFEMHRSGTSPTLFQFDAPMKYTTVGTVTNCSSAASPAVCAAAPSGSVAIATSGTTLTVDTTAVTANSQILITPDQSLGTKLGITCDTSAATAGPFVISARSAGTSFAILNTNPDSAGQVCLSYSIVN